MSGVARAGAIKLAGSLISGVFGFAFVIVVTRGLGKLGTGLFYEAVGLLLIGSSIAKLGADVGLIRMIPRYWTLGRTRDLRRLVYVGLVPVLIVGGGLSALLFILAPELAELAARDEASSDLVPYIRVLAPFLVLNAATTVLTNATRGFHTMVPLVVVNNIARPLARPVLAFAVLAAGMGGVAVAFAYGLPVAGGLVVALLWLLRLVRRAELLGTEEAPAPTPTARLASEFWRFASGRAAAAVFTTAVWWLQPLLLGALRSTADAGVYVAATRYINLGSFALTVLYLAISPQISALLSQGDKERASAMYQTSSAWLVLSSWPIYLTLAVFAPFVLQVFGGGFVEGQTALLILSLAQLFAMAAGPANTVLLMGGHSLLNTFNTVLGLTVNLALNLWLIPKYGLEGAAIAYAASIVSNNLAALIELRVFMKMSPVGIELSIVALGSAVCFGLLGLGARLALGPTWAGFLALSAVGGASYLAILWRYRETLHLLVLRDVVGTRARKRYGRRPEAGDVDPAAFEAGV
jgi:O-antigen/teichoic acid export membrane protein